MIETTSGSGGTVFTGTIEDFIEDSRRRLAESDDDLIRFTLAGQLFAASRFGEAALVASQIGHREGEPFDPSSTTKEYAVGELVAALKRSRHLYEDVAQEMGEGALPIVMQQYEMLIRGYEASV